VPSQTRRKRGRPPAGPRGEKVSSYPQMTIRLPLETRAKLNTLSLLLATPMWQIVDQAINVYVTHLPKRDQEILGPLVERLARGEWPVTSHWRAMWDRPATGTTEQHAAKPSARRQRTR
jgi:predicted DNA-binding protein